MKEQVFDIEALKKLQEYANNSGEPIYFIDVDGKIYDAVTCEEVKDESSDD